MKKTQYKRYNEEILHEHSPVIKGCIWGFILQLLRVVSGDLGRNNTIWSSQEFLFLGLQENRFYELFWGQCQAVRHNLTFWPLEWRADWTGILQMLFWLFSFSWPPEKSCAPGGHPQCCDITKKYSPVQPIHIDLIAFALLIWRTDQKYSSVTYKHCCLKVSWNTNNKNNSACFPLSSELNNRPNLTQIQVITFYNM